MSEQCIMVSSELVAVWVVFALIPVTNGEGMSCDSSTDNTLVQ